MQQEAANSSIDFDISTPCFIDALKIRVWEDTDEHDTYHTDELFWWVSLCLQLLKLDSKENFWSDPDGLPSYQQNRKSL